MIFSLLEENSELCKELERQSAQFTNYHSCSEHHIGQLLDDLEGVYESMASKETMLRRIHTSMISKESMIAPLEMECKV